MDCDEVGLLNFLWFNSLSRGKKMKHTKNLICLVTMWCFWSVHNKIIFQGVSKNIDTIVFGIKNIS